MARRASSHPLWAIFAILGSAIVLISFFLPYIITYSHQTTTSQSLWGATLTSPPEIRCYFTGAVLIYWLTFLLPMVVAFNMLRKRGGKSRTWLKLSVGLILLGFLMSLFFNVLAIALAGLGMPYHGTPPSHTFGPAFWLAPSGFLLSLVSYIIGLMQKAEISSSEA